MDGETLGETRPGPDRRQSAAPEVMEIVVRVTMIEDPADNFSAPAITAQLMMIAELSVHNQTTFRQQQ